jgi:hypothetical protein
MNKTEKLAVAEKIMKTVQHVFEADSSFIDNEWKLEIAIAIEDVDNHNSNGVEFTSNIIYELGCCNEIEELSFVHKMENLYEIIKKYKDHLLS